MTSVQFFFKKSFHPTVGVRGGGSPPPLHQQPVPTRVRGAGPPGEAAAAA